MPASDSELLAQWRDGDASSGEALIERYYDSIVRFFRTKTHGDIDDLVQRTFLRCSEAIARFRGEGSFRAFLFGIARNVLLEKIRSRARHRQRVDPDLGVTSVRDLNPGISTAMWRKREKQAMVDALQHIPLDMQLILELFYWEELSVAELAETLEIPPGTVKSRLFRARKLLKEQMDQAPLAPELQRSVQAQFGHWVRSDDGPEGASELPA